jgi:Flp pilus assembly CpaF family ATPase
LRMAPDVAIVGEVRDREVLPLLLTLSSGIQGFTVKSHSKRLFSHSKRQTQQISLKTPSMRLTENAFRQPLGLGLVAEVDGQRASRTSLFSAEPRVFAYKQHT